jgi:hypothetical protein
MPVQALDDHVRVDAEQFALPLLNQVRWADDQDDLIGAHCVRKPLHRTGRNGDRSRTAHCGLAGPHHAAQEDTITLLKALRDGSNDVLLRGIK